MPQLPSPRLPGVMVLAPDASFPQYSRWRRGVKSAFIAKGTWGHCDGTNPMPMPASGPNFFTPVTTSNPQPELLEERKSWVKKDRDVKLDIFLSVADDIKLEVFEVGPPLPPPSMTAKEMLEALDAHFEGFNFEEFHHVFCHFLNLHIDQYPSLEHFNAEFQATLDDMVDHGHPMTNIQACSAYFSKLRCTQNPWVAKKLKEWDAMGTAPVIADLLKESPPWAVIRPLVAATKSAQQAAQASIPEEDLTDSLPNSEGEEAASDRSETTTLSSKSSHSRNSSRSTMRSQEIIIAASMEDLTELHAFPNIPADKIPPAPVSISKRLTSNPSLPNLSMSLPPPVNRPLPPLPHEADKSDKRPRSVSPQPSEASKAETAIKVEAASDDSPRSSTPQAPEQVHPALRQTTPAPQAPEDVHPALRGTTSTPRSEIHPALRSPTPEATSVPAPASEGHISSAMLPRTPTFPLIKQSDFLTSSPNLTLISTPEIKKRPQSSRAAIGRESSIETFATWPATRPTLARIDSTNSSTISLPLQGTSTPEYRDQMITETNTLPSKLNFSRMSSPPAPKPYVGRVSSEFEDEKKARKRSWNLKARLSARHGVKEII